MADLTLLSNADFLKYYRENLNDETQAEALWVELRRRIDAGEAKKNVALTTTPAPAAPLADAELAELLTNATPAPWVSSDYGFQVIGDYESDFPRSVCQLDGKQPEVVQKANAGLIAAMRNALPGLLARLAASEAPRPWHLLPGLPEQPTDTTVEYWVAYPDGTVGTLYYGFECEMDENWDGDESWYTGWMVDDGGEGLSVYRGPLPTYYREMEPTPAAPTANAGKEQSNA